MLKNRKERRANAAALPRNQRQQLLHKQQIGGDTETNSKNKQTALVTDVSFVGDSPTGEGKILFEKSCRLPYDVIAEPGALLAQGRTFRSLQERDLQSSYQLTLKTANFLHENPNTRFSFFNSSYDIAVLQSNFYRNMCQPYLLKSGGRIPGCSREVILAGSVLNPTIKVGRKPCGAADTTLSGLTLANEQPKFEAHNATADALAAQRLEQEVLNKEPDLSHLVDVLSCKTEAASTLLESSFMLVPRYGREAATFHLYAPIMRHPHYDAHFLTANLRAPIFSTPLADEDYKKIRAGSFSGVIRKFQSNAGQLAIPSTDRSLIKRILDPKNFERAGSLAEKLRADDKLARAIVAGLTAQKKNYGVSPFVEEQMVSHGFGSPEDQGLRRRFHVVDPPSKLRLLDKFRDERFKEWGRRIIADNWPEIVPAKLLRQLHSEAWERLNTERRDVPWITIASALEEIELLMPGSDDRDAHILAQYQQDLLRMRAQRLMT